MIVAGLRRHAKVGTQEGCADLGNKFFHRVTGVTKTLAAKVTVETVFMASPVNRLMGAGGVVALGVAEGVQFGHVHGVERRAVESAAAAVLDRGTRVAKEAFDGIEARVVVV